jgi:hypothetical protein
MKNREQIYRAILGRSKAVPSGDYDDVVTPKESEETSWLELVRLPTETHLDCQNQNFKAWHHTWHHTLKKSGGRQQANQGSAW